MQAPHSAGPAASDPASRFWWRSKEALDTALVLETGLQAAPGVEYVIFLQDDIMLASGILLQLKSFMVDLSRSREIADVITLFTVGTTAAKPVKGHSVSGCVGLALRANMVPDLAAYIRSRFAEAPVDWLLNDFIEAKKKIEWAFHPNLVQHVGVTSSLAGKQQPLRSSSFKDTTCVTPVS